MYLCICIHRGFHSSSFSAECSYPFVRTVYLLQQPLVWRQNRLLQRNLWISRPPTTHMVFHVYNVFVNIIKLSYDFHFSIVQNTWCYIKEGKAQLFLFMRVQSWQAWASKENQKKGVGLDIVLYNLYIVQLYASFSIYNDDDIAQLGSPKNFLERKTEKESFPVVYTITSLSRLWDN